jgi:phage shock protein A
VRSQNVQAIMDEAKIWLDKWRDESKKVIALHRETETKTREQRVIEAKIAAEVTAATEGGKALFSNDTARKAEIADRLAGHETYGELQSEIDRLSLETKEAELEANYSLRMYKLHREFAGVKDA